MISSFYTMIRKGMVNRQATVLIATFAMLFAGFMKPTFGQITNPAPYCDVSDDCGGGFFANPRINSVSFGSSFSYNSGGCNNSGSVTYFNNLNPVPAQLGKTYSVSIELDGNFFNDKGSGLWIDFDQDGSFESNEFFGAGSVNTQGGNVTQQFQVTIPSTAKCGITRMRVKCDERATPIGEPCQMKNFDGEVEDYNIDIQPQTLGQDDVALGEILEPAQGRSDYGLESLKVIFSNASDQVIPSGTTIPFTVETTVGGKRQVDVTVNQDIQACGADTAELGLISLGCPGVNNVKVSHSWGPDVNSENNTTSNLYPIEGTRTRVVFEDFESGSAGSGWTVAGGTVNGNDGPRGNFHFSGFDNGPNYVEYEINLNKLNYPILSFWTKDINFPEVEGDDGFFISTDGGSTYTRITDLGIGNNNNYTKKTFTIIDVLQNNGLSIPANGKIIIRLSQDDTLSSEGVAYDDILIRDIPLANSKPAPSTSLFPQRDTVYVNSPVDFETLAESVANVWFESGNQVDRDTAQYTVEYPNTGTDSVALASAACYGVDTSKTAYDIVVPSRAPEADFVADRNFVDTNDVVQLFDESSIGPTNWEWYITPSSVNGDSAYRYVESSNTSRKPRVQFLKTGQYTVSLVASNSQGADTITRNQYITVGEGYRICEDSKSDNVRGILYDSAGTATFEDDDSKRCTFTINPACTDSITARFQSFNIAGDPENPGGPRDNLKIYDGTSTNAPAIHDRLGYSGGFYEGNVPQGVALVARSGAMTVEFNTNGDDSDEDFALRWEADRSADPATRQSVMNVGLSGPDTAFTTGFTRYQVANPVAGAQYKWKFPGFNSEVTNDTVNSLRGQGIDPGNYQVQLITRVCGYADTATKQVYFKDPSRAPLADFTASSRELKAGDTVQLIDQSKLGVNDWTWSVIPSGSVEFVRGTDENTPSPYVTINSSGSYRVELIAKNAIGSNVEDRLNYLTVKESCVPSVSITNEDYAINGFAVYKVGQGQLYSNTSGLSDNGYGKFNQQSAANLEAGQQYVFEVSRNTAFNNFAYAGWLDSDNDGVFTNQERLFSQQNVSGLTVRDTVTIGANAANQGVTDLRVATNVANGSLDGCGPHASGEFEDYAVTFVGDQTAPAISLKGGDTINVDICNVTAADTGAIATDAVDGNLSSKVQLRNSELLQVPGTHNLQYTVRDDAGNRASITQVAIVTPDTVDPQISLNGPSQVDVPFERDYEERGFTTSDACGTVDTVVISGSVNNGVVGEYTLNYIVTDLGGNTDTATRTVNVFDDVPPQAQLVGADTVRVPVFGDYEELGVAAIDNYRDSTVTTINGTVNTDSVGVYTLTYNVSDVDGNVVSLERVVIVEDRQAPSYSNVPEDAVVIDVNSELETDFIPEDNYYDASQLSLNRNGDFFRFFPDGVADSIGTFNARFTYTDGSGNTSTAAFGVEVVDREAPEIVLNRNTVNIAQFERFEDSLGVTYQVNDNYYEDTAITVERSGNYFTSYVDSGFPNGLYNIRYEAVDPSGNRADAVVRGVNVQVTGVRDKQLSGFVDVYPNPTEGPVRVEVADVQQGPVTVQVINAKGQTVREISRQVTGNTGDYNVDLSNEAKGLYKVKVQTSETVVTESVIVQ